MNALKLYHDLKARGVILVVQGEHLKVDAPAGELTEKVRAALVEFKPKLLKFLSRSHEEPQEVPERESVARCEEPTRFPGRGRQTKKGRCWVKATFPTLPVDGIMAGVVVRFCQDVSRTGRMGSMTDRRNDERERTENARERRRGDEERDRRSDELKESWRRNHPSEEEEKRPKRGRPA